MLQGHGDDIHAYDDIRLNFSSNVYCHFNHTTLFGYLAGEMQCIANYPEPTPLTLERRIASLLELSNRNVLVTSGATEAIYNIAQAFRGEKSAILQPTFSEYESACLMHGHDVVCITSLDDIDTVNARLVWLCNPNNPTGIVIDYDSLLATITAHEDTVFVIDQSYGRFTMKRLLTDAEACRLPNVLVLHSMTKDYAIPGLRLGYLTGNAELLGCVANCRVPWTVNALAVKAGHFLLDNAALYSFDVAALCNERERVAQRFNAFGITTLPSDTHILLCRLPGHSAAELKDYLALHHGILIRDAGNFTSLDQTYFRIAVQSPEDNDTLINAISQWLQR